MKQARRTAASTVLVLLALAGCAHPIDIDLSKFGTSAEEQARNSAEAVACDTQTAGNANLNPKSDAVASTREWRAAMHRRIARFDDCMASKGWLKTPMFGWHKPTGRRDELDNVDRGGE